ncbi:class I SAM-dependent methyltransferase [Pendulispora brunnea]|uniref:Class I SAM-dependent methyltransferase n=1 Tax=Pendulispora brunnea TaxID=2905690 RepID=A0ABZ2K985_9BACT
MLLKNLRPASDYDRFATETLAPWDLLFMARIRQLARDLRPGTIADIGTATAVVPVGLASDRSMGAWCFIGVDLDPTMLEEGRPRIRERGLEERIALHVGDAQALPFADESLTMSVSRATLHHLPDKAVSLREMYRVLEPGGVGLVHDMRRDAPQALLDKFTRMRAAANYPPTHLEEKLTLDEARALVAEAGLEAVSVVTSPNGGLSALGFEILMRKPAQVLQ